MQPPRPIPLPGQLGDLQHPIYHSPCSSAMIIDPKKTACTTAHIRVHLPVDRNERQSWWPQQESNLHLSLRRTPFYPLNYGAAGDCGRGAILEAGATIGQ